MSVKKILITTGIGIATAFLLAWIVIVIITVAYGHSIKSFVINQINQQLTTEVKVNGEISFSCFSNFPMASLSFYDVQIKESLPEKNNLIEAKKISLLFSIWNLFKNDYAIEKIEVEDGGVSIQYDQSGNPNYLILKSDSSSSSSFAMKINDAVLKNFYVHYSDAATNQYYSFQSKFSNLKGDFSSKKFTLNINADALSDYFKTEGDVFFQNKNIEVNGNIDCDFEKLIYTLQKTILKIEGNSFTMSGSIFPFQQSRQFDLKVSSSALQLKELIALLPEEYQSKVNEMNATGIVEFNCNISGIQSTTTNPVIKATFKLSDGTIGNKKINVAVNHLSLSGTYTNGTKQSLTTSSLTFKSIEATIDDQKVTGDFFIRDFKSPYIEFNANGKVQLEKLFSFFKSNEVKSMNGELIFHNCYYKGTIKQLITPSANTKLDAGGKFELQNISIETKQAIYSELNGAFIIEGNKISFSACSFKAGKSDLTFIGSVNNLFPFILSSMDSTAIKQKIGLAVSLSSKHLQWEELVGNSNSQNNTAKDSYSIPEIFYRITGSVDGVVSDFSFQKFKADSLHGRITFLLGQIYFSDIGMKTEQGSIEANAKLNITNSRRSILDGTATLKSLDISQLFFEFDDFGQTTLTNKNIKGKITASVSLRALWENNILNLNQLHAIADVTIKDGELNNFEPLMALATFVKVNELRNIRFSEMQNQIEIKNKQVLIPSMKIFSSALNLQLNGSHGFDNQIDYKIQLSLLKLLTDKFRKTNNNTLENEQTTEGFLNLYLSMTGDASNPEIKYDKAAVKQKINSDLAKEKTTLKETLKKEFSKQEVIQEKHEEEFIKQNNIQYFEFESDTTESE